jgi:hypothetical protein
VVKKKKLFLLLHPLPLLQLLTLLLHQLLLLLHLKPLSNFYFCEKKPPQGGFFSSEIFFT